MKMSDPNKQLPAKRSVFILVGDLAALMFFGAGYLVVDHFNEWIDTQTPSGASAQPSDSSKPSASHTLMDEVRSPTERTLSK
jgi:hypothetical protein